MQLIHLGTTLQSVFGLLDDSGNVVQHFTLSPNEGKPLTVFSPEVVGKAFQELVAGKERLAEQCQAQLPSSVDSAT